ncbi:MAG: flippase-like domain-containing protein [Solirubrobacterales bacterium]
MSPEQLNSRRRVIEIGIFAALVGGALVALPGLGDLRARLEGANPALVALAAAFEVGSCLAFVAAFKGVFSRNLPWRFSYEVAMAEQAANVLLPTGGAGGLALGAWALRRIGMPADRIGRRTVAFFLITSSINFGAVIVAGVALGTGVLDADVAAVIALGAASLAALFVATLLLIPRLADRAQAAPTGRVRSALARGREYLADGIRDAVRLFGSGRPLVVGGALGYMALDVLALAAMFAALGGGAPALGGFVFAYTVGQLGGLVPLPGGIGGTDGGLIAAFALLGTPVPVAAAAVLGYRAFQLGIPAILGVAAFAQLRRRLTDEPAPTALAPAPAPQPA